ncbi:MAG: PilZ domain-containing protein [Hyphomicrobiaceae bacterium]
MPEFAPVAATLAAELAEYEAFERFRSTRPDLPAADRRPLRVAVTLKGELLNAAVLIAAATSLVNAIDRGGERLPTARALSVFVPAPSASVSRAIERLLAEDIDLAICQLLQAYAARLFLAQRMSASFADDAGSTAATTHVDAEILADAWRRTCAAAAAAIRALDTIEGQLATAPTSGEARILELLARAEAGGTPCLDPDGRITIPGWAERRRERRQELRQTATATLGATLVPVVIRDASTSGLGLDLPREAQGGERLTVQLPGGREIAGEIAWSDGQRAGLRLDRRLTENDPLLAPGTTRAPRLKSEIPTS